LELLKKGKILFDLGRYEEAIDCFKKVVQMFPEIEFPKYLIGLSYYNLNKNDLAFSIADDLIASTPDQYHGYYLKSILLKRKDNHTKALHYIDAALRTDPNSVLLLNEKGYILVSLGRMTEALVIVKQSLKLAPRNSETLNLKAKVLSRKKYNRAETIRTLHSSLEIAPDDENTHRAAAIVNLRLGNLAASKKHTIEALKKDPSDQSVVKFLYHIEVQEHWFFNLFQKSDDYFEGPNKWGVTLLFLICLGGFTLFLLIAHDYSIIHFTPLLSILILGSVYGFLLEPIYDLVFFLKKERRTFLSLKKQYSVLLFISLTCLLFIFPILHSFYPKTNWLFNSSIIAALLFNVFSRIIMDWEDIVKTIFKLISFGIITIVLFAQDDIWRSQLKYVIFFIISAVYYILYFYIDTWRNTTLE